MVKFSNPLGFTPGPVTFFTTLIYLAALVSIIVVHTSVPAAPKSSAVSSAIDLNEAWLDLQLLTSSYHPYNSHANDQVHDWLLSRIHQITEANKRNVSSSQNTPTLVFDDDVTNLTFSSPKLATITGPGVSVYFEGKNIIVWIQGEQDDVSNKWWERLDGTPSQRNAVLVNAHYDSVSSGYGATDDGVGVVCILQLLRYYTTPGKRPKHGLVLLLNDGEEDFLNGAYVFSQHPMSKIVSSFLNLEGAGAGGRAMLFRSTDAEITKAYATSPFPFGSVVSADGFSKGLVRSQTDYVVFNEVIGLRGLDVAFYDPRARYHTNEDDTKHTSRASVYHMLSASLATTKSLTSKPLRTNLDPKNNPGHDAMWFDLFGRIFAVFEKHTFFGLSIALLVAGPIFLALTLVLLYVSDKLYLFSGSVKHHTETGDETVSLDGWKGAFRFPLVMLCACAAPIALAYLLFKENEYIVHSSEWAVWCMFASAFVFIAWFLCRVADFARPTSLSRAYALTWMWCAWWASLVLGVVLEEQVQVAGVYWLLIYAACTFLAVWLSYFELFSLPKKANFCDEKLDQDDTPGSPVASRTSRATSDARRGQASNDDASDEDEAPTESTSLLASRGGSVFKRYSTVAAEGDATNETNSVNERGREEQQWSKSQWSWLWLLQFIVLVPINLIVVGQIALLTVSAMHQTGSDGSNLFLVYVGMAIFSILLFSPLVPFIHRLAWQIPMFLFLLLIGTLIYNLVAFPFSANNRLKLYFRQELDLEHGNNTVYLIGPPGFVEAAVETLPSAKLSHAIHCKDSKGARSGRQCGFPSIPPKVAEIDEELESSQRYRDWLQFNGTRVREDSDTVKARFTIHGINTRSCKLVLKTPFSKVKVRGQALPDSRIPPVPVQGSQEIRLWSRSWNNTWEVTARFDDRDAIKDKIKGFAVCMWSDVNQQGVIPAYDEALHFAPEWVALTKAGDGLVEGYKYFEV